MILLLRLAALAVAVLLASGLPAFGAAEGVAVETVAPRSPGEAAGLRPGDLILSWSCAAAPPALPQPSGGPVRSPYDLVPAEIEEAPRRAVTLLGRRGDQEMSWRLTAGEWGLRTRPLAADRLRLWTLNQQARDLAAAGKYPEADAAWAGAIDALEKEGARQAAARLLLEWGRTFELRGAWSEAAERYRKSMAAARSLAPKSLAEARALDTLGIAAARQGDYAAAEPFLRQALAIREELAPGTAEVTGSLNNLGLLMARRGDLDRAEEYLRRGEEIQRRLAPYTTDHGLFFQNLGNLARTRGNLEEAERLHHRALEIFEKAAPGGEGVSDALFNLANVAIQRGDLAEADDLLQRSLAMPGHGTADEMDRSLILVILGNLASRRGELEMAESLYRRALEVQERLSPEGPRVAASLVNLGQVEIQRREFVKARAHLERSLTIQERLERPAGLEVAGSLDLLGQLEVAGGGDLARAERLLHRALEIYEKKASGSLELAETARDLGNLATRRGRPDEALAFYRRALDLQRRLAPGSTGEAEALRLAGLAERRAGRTGEAVRDLCGAIDVLDRQRARLGSNGDARTSFEADLGGYYHECLEGLVRSGRTAEAFHTLERGRARSFLSLLAERDLRLSDLPPELTAERRRINAAYDKAQEQLAHLGAGKDDERIERLTAELRDLRTRQEEILARIRRESPRSAALQDPRPLDLKATRAALDPGTVLLEYAMGEKRAWLFAVESAEAPGPGLSVHRLAASPESLRREVESFRRLLASPGTDRAALRSQGRRLYQVLIGPAAGPVARARRILISPDGALRTLPFAALARGDRYLIEEKPIHTALSATVYAELARTRPAKPRNPGEERLVAFGDPLYPKAARGLPDPEVRDALRRGWTLTPLPSTRKEVESIAALFPQGREYLGGEATEEKAKALGPDSRLIHFACHGVIDPRFPLNSALALTVPEHPAEGQDNGLLQAWEIFESVRLNADLVTLSACDTALGKEAGGEGLIGLTRAFQYAGARSVLASLWGISDYSTASFMKAFYGYLRSGKTKDEALRAAQIDQIRKKSGSSHPFFWAAFQLTGDWR